MAWTGSSTQRRSSSCCGCSRSSVCVVLLCESLVWVVCQQQQLYACGCGLLLAHCVCR